VRVLLDSNILVRLSRRDDAQFQIATQSIEAIRRDGHSICLIPQSLRQFWVVATRPREANGLGLGLSEAKELRTSFQQLFPTISDTAEVHVHWLRLTEEPGALGKKAHDVGYVAAMLAHGIESILTFDEGDFTRFAHIIKVWTPDRYLRERQQSQV
jgi:predicted nucleic acid-binding protein